MSNTKILSHRFIRPLLVLILLGSLLGALALAVWASVITVTIDSPTGGSPVYKQTGQTFDVTYDADGTLPGQVKFSVGVTLLHTANVTFPLTDTTQTLDLSGVEEGEYDLLVEAKETLQSGWPWDREADAVVVDNTAPTIVTDTLTIPNGGEAWAAGSAMTISWESGDITDDYLDYLGTDSSISLHLSTDGGTSYSQFATGEANDGSFPWTVPWVVTSNAKVKIVATDLAGNAVNDVSDNVFTIYNVDTTPPVVTLTAPPDGTYVAGVAVVVSATAMDSQSGITQVQFQNDLASWANFDVADTTSPYSVTWDSTGLGDGTVVPWRAIATNGALVTTISASRAVTVDNSVPTTVTLTSPLPQAYITGTVTLTATAADDHSGITQVEFFLDGASMGLDYTTPYTQTWATSTDGVYTLTITATNGAALTTTTGPITVTVDNIPPAIPTLTSPTTGDVWMIGDTKPISWTGVSDTNLLAFPVTLFVQPGGGWVEIDTAGGLLPSYAPSGWNWTVAGMPSSAAKVKMVVTDKAGNTSYAESNAFTIWGADATGPDTLTLNKPTTGTYTGTVALEAKAGDSKSGIQEVEFFYQKAGTTTWTWIDIGFTPEMPKMVAGLLPKTYTAEWDTEQVPSGSYTVKVVATNGVGIEAEDSVADVIVDNPVPTVSLTDPRPCQIITGTVTITATVGDGDDGTGGIDDVKFYYYDAVQEEWELIDTIVVTDTSPYTQTWVTTGLSGEVDLKAVATDNAGNAAEDGHSVFVGTLAANQHLNNQLVAGWNLISLQAVPDITNVQALLACLVANDSMDWVGTFDASLNWLLWDPSEPIQPSLTDMYDGRAHWVDMFEAADFTFTEQAPGTGSPPAYNVNVGWNFIGFTRTAPDTPVNYLQAVEPHVQAMYGWLPGLQAYYAVGAVLNPGEGYWMALDAAGTIYP